MNLEVMPRAPCMPLRMLDWTRRGKQQITERWQRCVDMRHFSHKLLVWWVDEFVYVGLTDLSHWHPDDSIRDLFIPDRWRAGTTFRHIGFKYNIPEKSFKITLHKLQLLLTSQASPKFCRLYVFFPFWDGTFEFDRKETGVPQSPITLPPM